MAKHVAVLMGAWSVEREVSLASGAACAGALEAQDDRVTVSRFAAAKAHVLPPPDVLKPGDEGSSVGVLVVQEGREHPLQEIARAGWLCGEMLLAERFVAGREPACAVMNGRSLGVTEMQAATGEFYDDDAKYAKGGSIHTCPAQILPKIYQQIEEWSLTAHQAIGCRGVSRADFRYHDETDTLVWLEVNTQPGMTETSLVPELAAHAGFNFGELVKWMVDDASLDR